MVSACFCRSAVAIAALAASFAPASAQSMREAVEMALDTSPRLQAERTRLRGIEELPIQALNQRRPQVRVAVDAAAGRSGQSLPGDFVWEGSSPVGATISLSQPLLTGGSVQASYREGQLRVAAGVARMRALQFVLIREVLITYADVLREHDILDVRIEGAANLAEQLAATEARQAVGLIGLTDVAQARTRLESARGQEALARSRLMGAWARLEQLIAHGGLYSKLWKMQMYGRGGQ